MRAKAIATSVAALRMLMERDKLTILGTSARDVNPALSEEKNKFSLWRANDRIKWMFTLSKSMLQAHHQYIRTLGSCQNVLPSVTPNSPRARTI